MSQEPWNEEVYHNDSISRKERLRTGLASTKVFTILAFIFFIIVLIIGITALYLSIGGSHTDSTKEFYNATATSIVAETAEQAPVEEEAVDAGSTPENTGGETLTVQPGEGVGQLAARAGVSIAELEKLNPEKMTTGSWLAHPGDTVRIR